MDSMRSLNTSLPIPPPPPEQLLQAFKSAALSVTNLYKAAAADQSQIRHAGYQEAINDLLSFLDKENLGLGDGEGWQVRQWATERSDGWNGNVASESEDDRGENEKEARSSSPVVQRKRTSESLGPRQHSRSASPVRPTPEAQPPTLVAEPQPSSESSLGPNNTYPSLRSTSFTFTAEPHFPHPQSSDIDMQSSEAASSDTPAQLEQLPTPAAPTGPPPVRLEVHPRGSRTPHRHGNNTWHNTRSSNRDTGIGTGSKRKIHLGEFFDFSNLGNGKDGFGGGGGGGKRTRFT